MVLSTPSWPEVPWRVLFMPDFLEINGKNSLKIFGLLFNMCVLFSWLINN